MRKGFALLVLFLLLPLQVYGRVKEEPLLRVGVLSDVHVGLLDTPDGARADSIFIVALKYFRDCRIDAMVIAGDLVESGMECELARVAKDWFSVFPGDRDPDGRHVERIFIFGNHEIDGHTYRWVPRFYEAAYIRDHNIASHREAYWEKYFHESYQPFYRKDVKGFTFLAAHYVTKSEAPGLEEFFREQEGSLPPAEKPFFYVQHNHPKGTIPWGADNGNSTRILSRFPNLICFSGHCHTSLTDERSIWQGAFTCINTGTLRYVGRWENKENSSTPVGYVSQMEAIKGRDCNQGMLMLVYEDRIELHRHDFHTGGSLGVWTIPTDVTKRPYAPAGRKAIGALHPPTFRKGACIRTKREMGNSRLKESLMQIRTSFPVAVSRGKRPRAHDYFVSVELAGTDSTVLVKRVYSPGFYLAEKADKKRRAECLFSEAELPRGVPFRFAVRPADSFGNEGPPIYSKILEL